MNEEGVRLAALQHHEKIDGTGYPLRLEGSKIHVYAKIVGITDIFHAMTLRRIYRKAQSPYIVLRANSFRGIRQAGSDARPNIYQKATEFHNGTKVRLSNHQIGEIVFTDEINRRVPMVSIGGEIINLAQKPQLYIEEVFIFKLNS
ncbi:HD-GYP domain-containing protein [Paenibacillus sp. FSL M7-0831]|uniref:HD-GYP domain-containing protein n=1 Tax=Paenibacillus sp. FSL M7-0831 TaxID=2975314 RepID=UPI0030F85810